MILNFQKSLTEFKYVLCFDLAKFETGVSFINIKDINNPKVEETFQISIDKKDISAFGKFYEILNTFFQDLVSKVPKKDILIIREKQPSGFTKTTTIGTLQALAGIHAILDIIIYQYNIYEYQDGIHAASVKAWARRQTNLEKPTKEDIMNYLMEKHNYLNKKNITLDISDSIALCECLLSEKWNTDLKEVIKEENKHLKQLKLENAKIKQQKIIDSLTDRLLK